MTSPHQSIGCVGPIWLACLETGQPDPEVRHYLQMRAGACVLGVPTENLDVHYGTGANGKSKFHGAIQNAVGAGPTGYSIVPHKSLLMAQRLDEHATVYADLFRQRDRPADAERMSSRVVPDC